jgi:hypothetical protein
MREQEKRLDAIAVAARRLGPRLAAQVAPLAVDDREEALWIYEKALLQQVGSILGVSSEVRDEVVGLDMGIVRDRIEEIDAGDGQKSGNA